MLQRLLIIFTFIAVSASLIAQSSSRLERDKAFLESFVNYYEFNTMGRYAHEYHDFLLKKTSGSFDELEEHLKITGFNLKSRIVMTGYEEHSVPRYFTNFTECDGGKINDEASSKSDAGWSKTLHNRFGLMTGFLFRYANNLFAISDESPCEHLNPQTIEIYDDRASVFQEDAFGPAYKNMIKREKVILKKIGQKDMTGVFGQLIKFWESLYYGSSESADGSIAGTQDMLFTVEHARHLHRSDLPLRKYFVGPDITYPIDPSTRCLAEATTNAQQFVKRMVKELYPIEDKVTCYVFRSFVDGVGKSTMLGNIKNWMKHGSAIHEYEAVDNTSSQYADIFQYAPNVFIADLPAQISHFTYKPDGLVYADARAEKLPDARLREITQYVIDNKSKIFAQYRAEYESVYKIIEATGWHADGDFAADEPQKLFIRNLLLLKKTENNRWVPFKYQGHNYLVYADDFTQLRILKPLSLASSIGLKNAQSEQMLFTDGVRLPIAYKHFLDHFEKQLKDQGIENIVFVDFLSMYPRSSRENIRINYLLQQMAMLDNTFSVEHSFYRDFVNNSELFYLLKKRSSGLAIAHGFKQEALLRLHLNQLMEENEAEDVTPIPFPVMDAQLGEHRKVLNPQLKLFLDNLLTDKIKRELSNLESLYGMRKAYVNIQSLSIPAVVKFSETIEKILGSGIKDSRLNALWGNFGSVVNSSINFSQGAVKSNQPLISLAGGAPVQALYVINPECKNSVVLAPFIKMMRVYWYAALSNLVHYKSHQAAGRAGTSHKPDGSCEKLAVPPVVLKMSPRGMVYAVQRDFGDTEQVVVKFESKWGMLNPKVNCKTGFFDGKRYPLEWPVNDTSVNVYGLGNDKPDYASDFGMSPYATESIHYMIQDIQNKGSSDNTIAAVDVYARYARESRKWIRHRIERTAKPEGQKNKKKPDQHDDMPPLEEVDDITAEERWKKQVTAPLIFAGQERIEGAQLFVRAIATLEMIMPDPESVIAVRKGNKQDFVAALKLVEEVVLPQFFRIAFKHPLFDDYESVEPLVPLSELGVH